MSGTGVSSCLSIVWVLIIMVTTAGCVRDADSLTGGRSDLAALDSGAGNVPRPNRRVHEIDEGDAAIDVTHIDPGAASLVAQVRQAIGQSDDAGDPTVIHLRQLRNQSRSPQSELDELRLRLLDLLVPAGEEANLRFSPSPSAQTEYTLGATVYLIQRDGFDQWEIYLSLRPIDASWTIWDNNTPVRILRQPAPGGDAIAFSSDQ